MKKITQYNAVLVTFLMLFIMPFSVAFADDDDHRGDKAKWYKKIFDHDDDDDHRGDKAKWYKKIFDHDDDDDHDDDHDDDDHKNKYLTPVNNDTFKQECGACHFAYQPGLLPSGSWGKILSNLTSHFGEEVSLDRESKNIIAEYLQSNAAEHSSAKSARKILKSLKGQTPLRITETPYIQEKHHELDSKVFSREAIGSISNCIACHSTAELGNYDDDFVKIPK